MGRQLRAQRGFTLVELMIVVAIVAVLAAIVVPQFTKDSIRTKAKSEVTPMFAEIATRQETYKSEKDAYLPVATCPPAASTTAMDLTTGSGTCRSSADWVALNLNPSATAVNCSYTVYAGDSATPPSTIPTWVTTIVPSTAWYYIHAVCPENEYFSASWDTKIRSKDGK